MDLRGGPFGGLWHKDGGLGPPPVNDCHVSKKYRMMGAEIIPQALSFSASLFVCFNLGDKTACTHWVDWVCHTAGLNVLQKGKVSWLMEWAQNEKRRADLGLQYWTMGLTKVTYQYQSTDGWFKASAHDVDEIWYLLRYYSEWNGNSVPTFLENLSLLSSRFSDHLILQ